MESAENTVKRLENTLALIEQGIEGPDINLDFTEREEDLLYIVREEKKKFIEAMDDDFNTPVALSNIHTIREAINRYLSKVPNKGVLGEVSKIYKELLRVLGLMVESKKVKDELSEELLKIIIETREGMRNAKHYEISDLIRKRLKDIGIEIQDTSEGTSWKISS